MYEKLKDITKHNGDWMMPRRYKKDGLDDWFHRQKKSYHSTKDSEDSFLQDRITKLEELGFVYDQPS